MAAGLCEELSTVTGAESPSLLPLLTAALNLIKSRKKEEAEGRALKDCLPQPQRLTADQKLLCSLETLVVNSPQINCSGLNLPLNSFFNSLS